MSEYLVEVTPGREVLYRTPWELRAAMRQGDITADSRILHRATSSWISITEHPEYQRFLAELHPRPWLDPPMPPESLAPPADSKAPGFLRGLAKTGAKLASSGWTSARKLFDSYRTKAAKPPTPAKPPKPAPSAQPGQPAQQTGQERPEPTRNRWTFYP